MLAARSRASRGRPPFALAGPPPAELQPDTETTGLDPARDRIIGRRAAPRREARETALRPFVHADMPVPLAVTRMTGTPTPTRATRRRRLRSSSFRRLAGPLPVTQRSLRPRAPEAAGVPGCPPGERLVRHARGRPAALPEHDRHALRLPPPRPPPATGRCPTPRRPRPAAPVERAGLAAEERRLLEAVRWRLLRLLHRIGARPTIAAAARRRRADGARGAGSPPFLRGRRLARRARCAARADGRRTRPGDAKATAARLRRRHGRRPRGAPPCHRRVKARSPWRRPSPACSSAAASSEAGTGMGKSLAYLLPAAFSSAARGARVVVATKTKALQRQLAAHELPLVEAALPSGWRWSLLMGRENYLCRRLVEEAAADAAARLDEPDRCLALAYLIGRARWGDVDLSALPYRAGEVLPALRSVAREAFTSATCPADVARRAGCHWRLGRRGLPRRRQPCPAPPASTCCPHDDALSTKPTCCATRPSHPAMRPTDHTRACRNRFCGRQPARRASRASAAEHAHARLLRAAADACERGAPARFTRPGGRSDHFARRTDEHDEATPSACGHAAARTAGVEASLRRACCSPRRALRLSRLCALGLCPRSTASAWPFSASPATLSARRPARRPTQRSTRPGRAARFAQAATGPAGPRRPH
jgi:hypothetical protein